MKENNSEYLLDCIGSIDDEYIVESSDTENVKIKKRFSTSIVKYSLLASCIILAIFIGLNFITNNKSLEPYDNSIVNVRYNGTKYLLLNVENTLPDGYIKSNDTVLINTGLVSGDFNIYSKPKNSNVFFIYVDSKNAEKGYWKFVIEDLYNNTYIYFEGNLYKSTSGNSGYLSVLPNGCEHKGKLVFKSSDYPSDEFMTNESDYNNCDLYASIDKTSIYVQNDNNISSGKLEYATFSLFK